MMEPLLKWGVLAGEFYNFLGNYTSPERTNWRYLAFTVHRNLLDKLITQWLYLVFLVFISHLILQPLFGQKLQWLSIFSWQGFRQSFVLCPKFIHSVQYCVQLFRIAELLPTTNREFRATRSIRISQALLKTIERNLFRNFHLSGDSSSHILMESCCISDCEALRIFYFYSITLSIYFLHSFDFHKFDCITVTQPVLLLLVNIHTCFFLIGDPEHMIDNLLLPSPIKNRMLISKVYESVSIEPQISSRYKPNSFVPADLVEFCQVFFIIMIKDNHKVKASRTGISKICTFIRLMGLWGCSHPHLGSNFWASR